MALLYLLLFAIVYGLLWGTFQYWGYHRLEKKVYASPEKFPPFVVRLFKSRSRMLKAFLSFFVALVVPLALLFLLLLIGRLFS